ncbi:hypothetical protein GOARA_058_00050 [Gordonia araii NBRC 100433]|uniref:Coenzyme Q-binding protein COQ10 START domain-containing protein n=1 Tax=Gordonia araii NBRC 100433 TaxID=1073574 RepID=G7H3U7_9ACTN|nr:hypothetical protein [Gordonia araii]NNG97338.1 hypothetical protein [Gordonia araii NBRC 100433]GAB10522.1 hypothetical protein GOARA_058_00050 [Gordonia araii NBRC 100433]
MAVVTVSSELPLSAARAAAMAAVPDVMLFVLAPVLSFSMDEAPAPGEPIEPGFTATGRVWWLGFIPTWKHTISVVSLDALEIYTNEHGGPVHTWNHRLRFEPLGEHRCRYTDEIEVEDGLRGLPMRGFVRLMFGHRHRRWQTLAAVANAIDAQPPG